MTVDKISFHKLDDGSWGVKADAIHHAGEPTSRPGQEVTVNKRDGSTSQVMLGEEVARWKNVRVFRVARGSQRSRTERVERSEEAPQGKKALNLANRTEYLDVTECKFCHADIAWATSKSGKRYPVDTQAKVDPEHGSNRAVLRAAPWHPHTREVCEKNQERSAALRKEMV